MSSTAITHVYNNNNNNNNNTPATLPVVADSPSVVKVSSKFVKLNTPDTPPLPSTVAATHALVVSPDVLYQLKLAESHVIHRSNAKEFENNPLSIVERPEIVSCLEVIKVGTTSEFFLRACTNVSVFATSSDKKTHAADMIRLWRVHPTTLTAIKDNAAAENSIYAKTPENEALFKKLDRLKAFDVDDGNVKSKTRLSVDYPHLFDFGKYGKPVAAHPSLAASKMRAMMKEKELYNRTEGRSDNVKRKYVELLSSPSAGTVVFKLSKATVLSNTLTTDGSVVVVMQKTDSDLVQEAEDAAMEQEEDEE